jgi:hypothetical protein
LIANTAIFFDPAMTLEAEDTAMIRALDLRLLRAAVDASGETILIHPC